MTDVERLLGWFADGTLVRPDASAPNTFDFALAIASLCGVTDLALTPSAQHISADVGGAEHLIVVLVDGLGMNLIERTPRDGFLRGHTVRELQAVFPSSTACALTTLATLAWPAEHGVVGWFAYLREHGLTAAVLPFVERFSREPLNVTGASVFGYPTAGHRFARDRAWALPKAIAHSVYTTYSSGGASCRGYERLSDAVDLIARRVREANAPTYTYWYIPDVDYAEHAQGPSHPDVDRIVKRVEQRVEQLAKAVAGRARIVVTADHGQIDILDEQRHVLGVDDQLLAHLEVPPSCEPRVPAFHVVPGRHDAFAREFRERFGATWVLLSVEEADTMRLLGPSALGDVARERLGDFIALNNTHELMIMPSTSEPLLGSHGGLLPDEMRIPLIVI